MIFSRYILSPFIFLRVLRAFGRYLRVGAFWSLEKLYHKNKNRYLLVREEKERKRRKKKEKEENGKRGKEEKFVDSQPNRSPFVAIVG